jgi:hypothetical protein
MRTTHTYVCQQVLLMHGLNLCAAYTNDAAHAYECSVPTIHIQLNSRLDRLLQSTIECLFYVDYLTVTASHSHKLVLAQGKSGWYQILRHFLQDSYYEHLHKLMLAHMNQGASS